MQRVLGAMQPQAGVFKRRQQQHGDLIMCRQDTFLAFVWHLQIPDYLKIDTEESLLGSMKPYKRHVLFQTPGGCLPMASSGHHHVQFQAHTLIT